MDNAPTNFAPIEIGPKAKRVLVIAMILVAADFLLMMTSQYRSLWPGLPIWIMVVFGILVSVCGALYVRKATENIHTLFLVISILGFSSSFLANFVAIEVNGHMGREAYTVYRLKGVYGTYQSWVDSTNIAPDINLVKRSGNPWRYKNPGEESGLLVKYGPLPFYVMKTSQFDSLFVD